MFRMFKSKESEKWDDWFIKEVQKDYLNKILVRIVEDKKEHVVYPQRIFRALSYPKKEIKVVIIGNAPYHNPLEADGLAFSATNLDSPPFALENIYRKIEDELGIQCDYENNDLYKWARQGVMLLNVNLTTRAGAYNSHAFLEWSNFTSRVLEETYLDGRPKVYICLENEAASILNFLNYKYGHKGHLLLYGDSPTSRFFFRVDYFKKTNQFLEKHGHTPIDWK